MNPTDLARNALARLAPAIETAPPTAYTLVLDTLIVAKALGFPLAPQTPVARALATFAAGLPTALDALEAADLLSVAEGFVPPTLAPALADRLAVRGILPSGRLLAGMLARVDLRRCVDLVARLSDVEAIDATAEATVTLLDLGAEVPPELRLTDERPFDPDALAAWYAARLRIAARRDPVEALDGLVEAVDEVGAAELGIALPAVLARVDPDAGWRTFERLAWHAHRAAALSAMCFQRAPDPRADREIAHLLEELRRRAPTMDASPRGWFQSTMPLLALSARWRRVDVAVEVVEIAGPSIAALRLATWEGGRVASLREGCSDPAFWDTLAEACSRRGPGPASGGPAALLEPLDTDVAAAWWRVATLPLVELPWYGSCGPRVP